MNKEGGNTYVSRWINNHGGLKVGTMLRRCLAVISLKVICLQFINVGNKVVCLQFIHVENMQPYADHLRSFLYTVGRVEKLFTACGSNVDAHCGAGWHT